ncbi:ATP-binding protein [Dyadobacter sp. CY345]|uniref:tetratricopeptide repeat-containing sensor histidine kinase n=1 Tax=Dyadobacter sp. CY345 TaxID=2909335 RepID=UPI001F2429DE|nr:histidine kinase dimerization/phosphoacceptor domain -containing protein [Dyadobacter sp. CY345]MCF2444780.1 ATP-binding protein [Dyadobacter sp. CY345]
MHLNGAAQVRNNDLTKSQGETNNDTNYIVKLLHTGSYFLDKPDASLPDIKKAESYFGRAFTMSDSTKLKFHWQESLFLLGTAAIRRGDLVNGRRFFRRVINSVDNSNNIDEMSEAWFRFGQAFMRIKSHFSPQLVDDRNYDEMMTCFQTALKFVKKGNNKEKQSGILVQMADFIYLQKGNLTDAEDLYYQVLAFKKEIGTSKMQEAYSGLMGLNYFRGDFSKALCYGMQALTSAENTQGYNNLDIVFFYFGNIYRDMGDNQSSLEQYQKALTLIEEKGEFEYLYAATLRNTVRVMIAQGKEHQALAFLQNQKKKHPPVYPITKTMFAESFGHCYNALKEFPLAEKYFDEMSVWSKKIGGIRAIYLYYAIGKFYFDVKKYDKSKRYLSQVLTAPPGIVPVSILQRAYLMSFQIDSASSDYVSAIEHFRQHSMLKDSVFNVINSRQIEELKIKYETENKEKDIKILRNQTQLQEAAQTRNIIITGGIFLFFLMGIGFYRYYIKQQSHKQLQAKQEVINQKNASLESLLWEQGKLLNEKEWLLKEIHHRVKNNLQIVMSLLNTQSAFIDNEAALKAIRHSQHRMFAMSLIHQKLYESQSVAKVEMLVYIKELIAYLLDSFDTKSHIDFNTKIDFIELDVSQAVPVGLILNEAITNSIKSAFQGREKGIITIIMEWLNANEVSLEISDNGIGLTQDIDIGKRKTLGMSLMSGLSLQLGGTFNIESKDGVSISIIFKVEKVINYNSKSAEGQIPNT